MRTEHGFDDDDDLGERTRKIGTPTHFRWLHGVVAAVLLLNLFDAALTIFFVTSGLAREANPFMAELIDRNAVLFAGVKMVLVSGGSYLLWLHRRRAASVVAIFVAFLAYYAVLVHHLSAMDVRLVERLAALWSAVSG